MDTQFTSPELGSKVAITFTFPNYVLNGPKEKTTTITGVVEKATKFTPPNFVRLITDFDNPVRIREIPLARVVNIKYTDGRVAIRDTVDTGNQTWTVEGSRGAKYFVVKNQNSYSCTCPGFQFRRSCKHIQNIQQI